MYLNVTFAPGTVTEMSDESVSRPLVRPYHIDTRESEILRVVVLRALTATKAAHLPE